LATVVFLDLNGFSTDLSDDEAVDLVREVTSTSPDVGALAVRLRTAG